MATGGLRYESCSIQVRLPEEYAAEIQEWSRKYISDEILYFDKDGDYGRDTRSHITVCIGLREKDLGSYVPLIEESFGAELATKGVKVWEQKDFDVILLAVRESYELTTAFRKLKPLADEKLVRRKYEPHISIAFVKPGLGNSLIRSLSWAQRSVIENREWILEEMEMVTRDARYLPIQKLTGTQENEETED